MQSTPSVQSLPVPLCPRVVAPDKVKSMTQIEQLDIQTECKLITYAKKDSLK